MTHKIYAPNIHLFAFHLRNASITDSQADTDYDSKLLWHKCNEIFAKFQIQQKLEVREVAEDSRIALLKGATKKNILLPLEGKISLNNEKQLKITGRACPLQIYDSYALALNIRIPELEDNQEKTEEVELTVLEYFNPDKCFLPSQINSSLGQILLLTVWLSQKQQQDSNLWQEIADECVQNFLGEKDQEKCLPLYQEGQLFGSPIFEYGIPHQSQVDSQILVWLFLGEEINGKYAARADENLGFFYQYFIDLFFYRQKVIKAYQISREVYSDIYQGYQKIKQIINEIAQIIPGNQHWTAQTIPENKHLIVLKQAQTSQDLLSEAELFDLKNKLRILPKLDLEYSNWLQQLKRYRLAIKVNSHDFLEKFRQIQEKSPNEDLSFLSVFSQKISSKFQNQIQVDLSYFVHSSGLLDKAISSIRGIVEIEQAERDRALEKTLREKEEAAEKREKSLQRWIALVGTGLAVSGISSQTDAKPVETILTRLYPNQSLDCPTAGLNPCLIYSGVYVVFHVGVGAIAALILWVIIRLGSKRKIDN